VSELENFRLRVFRAVAEHLSFRKAAEHLLLTQPAVTLQIKALEDSLGVRLFDRSARGISLTVQGKLLLPYAEKMAELAAQAERELGAAEGAVSGDLSIGVSTTIAQYVLPWLLGAFLGENARVQIALHSGNTRDIVDMVLDGKASLGLIEGPAGSRACAASLSWKTNWFQSCSRTLL
jgi:LysR family transcriptional regulator, transcriptional activator of the cysJI operon